MGLQLVDSLGAAERAALQDVVDMIEDLMDRARTLVAAGSRPIDAVTEVLTTSDPRATAAAAMLAMLAALDLEANQRRPTPELTH